MERVPGCATHGQGGIYTKEGSRGQFSKIQVDYKEEDYVLRLIGRYGFGFAVVYWTGLRLLKFRGWVNLGMYYYGGRHDSTRECTVIFSLH